ncbi:IS630 family transposase [Leptolyngbya boryana CZ1]|uniref:IS630 family transposase n=1 Tax=Leptolyngbya boryana CZ1 TaxID=3060204 RepID=A0AA96WR38_LEPBY|nr:IS630 family transposase [Leptolyngbya boryana]WNZ44072.1 IS630 family transposase [Leptolyngbya boryana CZ1]
MQFTREVFPETQHLLQRLYRQSRHHQVRQRAHCILLSSQDYSIAQLMEIFSVSRKTLYNWFSNWETQGVLGLYNQPGRGRKSTFNSEHIEQIRVWVKQQPKQLKQVAQKIQEEWGITTSTQTIKRVLKAVRMSWHRFRRVVGGQPDAQEYEQKQTELEYLKQLETQGELDLYYLDEVGFCLIPCVPYGWQLIGQTEEIESQRSQRLNVLGLMSRTNQLHSYMSTQSITSEVVIACIDAFFPNVNKRTVIVVDQASIHRSDAIYDKLQDWQDRGIEIFQLPSYSPQLNLIEILWRFIKYEWIEISAYRSWQSLVQYVEKVLKEFGENYVTNFV